MGSWARAPGQSEPCEVALGDCNHVLVTWRPGAALNRGAGSLRWVLLAARSRFHEDSRASSCRPRWESGGEGSRGEATVSFTTCVPQAGGGEGWHGVWVEPSPGRLTWFGFSFHLLALGELLSVPTGMIPMSQGRFGDAMREVTTAANTY